MTANTPASRKAKGRVFQQQLREDLIRELNINPDDILSTAMGQGGCDLYLSPAARSIFPFGVEAKRCETISLPAWWKQCESNASKVGLIPLLVFKRNREEPLAVLRWSDLLALLQQDRRWENLAALRAARLEGR
ncbi:putative PDDEXK endonuclease [Candidatus Darwinibacter acetoxidans]